MNAKIINEGLKYGVVGGLIFLLVNLGAWGLGTTATYYSAVSISSFIPYMIIMLIIVGLGLRKGNNNVLSFQEALKFTFVAYITVAFIEAVGNYVLYNFIDHNLTAKVFEISKAKALKMLQTLGASDQQIDDTIKKLNADSEQTTLKNVVLGFGLALVWSFCKSLLIALVIRKEVKFSEEA